MYLFGLTFPNVKLPIQIKNKSTPPSLMENKEFSTVLCSQKGKKLVCPQRLDSFVFKNKCFGALNCGFSFTERANIKQIMYLGICASLLSPTSDYLA